MLFYKKYFQKVGFYISFYLSIVSSLCLFSPVSHAVEETIAPINYSQDYDYSPSSEKIIEITTPIFNSLKFDTQSGQIIYLSLTNFQESVSSDQPIALLDNHNSIEYKANINSQDDMRFTKYDIVKLDHDKHKIIFSGMHEGCLVELTYIIDDNKYVIEVEQYVHNLNQHAVSMSSNYRLDMYKLSELKDKDITWYSERDTKAQTQKFTSFQKKPIVKNSIVWLSQHDKYFTTVMLPLNASNVTSVYNIDTNSLSFEISNLEILSPLKEARSQSFLYVGPKDQTFLKQACASLPMFLSNKKSYYALESIDSKGFFPSVYNMVLGIMKAVQSFVKNWGFTIILTTLLFKIITLPIVILTKRNQQKLLDSKSIFEAVERNYKNNDQLNQKMMEAYQQAGINPLTTMLLIFLQFIQLPILYAIYYVINGNIIFRHAPFLLWIKDLSTRDPYWILQAICCISIFVYTYLQLQQLYSSQDAAGTQNQKFVIYWITFIIVIFTLISPSGLVLYWLTSNIFNIIYALVSGSTL